MMMMMMMLTCEIADFNMNFIHSIRSVYFFIEKVVSHTLKESKINMTHTIQNKWPKMMQTNRSK